MARCSSVSSTPAPRNQAWFGLWRHIPDEEIVESVRAQGFEITAHERFRPSYGVPLLPIKYTRRLQSGVHRVLLDYLLAPVLPRRLGGLLLVVAERKTQR